MPSDRSSETMGTGNRVCGDGREWIKTKNAEWESVPASLSTVNPLHVGSITGL